MSPSLADELARTLGLQREGMRSERAGGGCIADSTILDDGERRVFVKRVAAARAELLDAERDGLERLRAVGEIRVPAVLGVGIHRETAWLALECLPMGRLSVDGQAALGEALAGMHGHVAARHGLDVDNFIGATPQRNAPDADWTGFFFDRRLGDQMALLARNHSGFGPRRLEALRTAWREAFEDYAPRPSLLHGDLWSGNAAELPDGTPVVFDPAVHYGDRECDLAMAALFGGFGAAFFDAYSDCWPLKPGWRQRRGFYQLYHVLNHANLFGGGYVADSRRRIDALTRR